jgi:hypothetical protein
MESEFRSAQVVPYSQLRVGDLSTVWFEATAGTNDPLFYFNIFGVGAGLRLPFGLRGRAGFTYHGKLIADALGDEEGRGAGNLKFAASADDTADPGGYLEVRYVPPGGGLGAELGVMGAESPALRLGVNYTFPVED